jgi:putative PIN family toxin of toxin-antitoxin system
VARASAWAFGSLSISVVVSLVGMAYHTGMKPQIVLDTNVLVAALRSRRGTAFQLVSLLPAAPFEINLSVPLVFEYEEVLPQHRHIMGLTLTDIADFLDFLCSIAHLHEIFFLWRPTLTDPNDEMLLELAVKARCQYIVTYNTRNFRGADQFGIAIVTPKVLLETIGVLP